MNALQLAVVREARDDLGCVESGRPNGGPCVNALQGITGALNAAWCASAVSTWWFRAGLTQRIVTAGTADLVNQARDRGWLTSEPIMGSAVVWRPGPFGHTEIFIEWVDRARNLARTIGGNTGDAVREHFRDVSGAYFVTPPELREVPKPVYRDVYWWEDPKAEPVRHGLYAAIASREKAVRAWVADHGSPGHVRRGKLSVRDAHGRLVPRFTFWTGERKRSPDFTGSGAKKRRDADMHKVAGQRPGHVLRPRTARVRVS